MRRLSTKLREFRTKHNLAVIAFAVLFAGAGAIALHAAFGAPLEPATEGLIVRYKPGVDDASLQPKYDDQRAVEVNEIEPLRADVLKVPESRVDDAVEELSQDPRVESVEPDYVGHAEAAVPNDPAYTQQWAWPKTRTDRVWDVAKSEDSMVIAVIDSGVDATHPDLAGKLVPGHNFVDGNDDPSDDYGHGTAVSGVIAAATDNAVGIAGGCWNCKVMPLKALDYLGSGDVSKVAEAVQYAADNGAKVINLSLSFAEDSSIMQAAVEYAEGKGVLVVAAAGNQSQAEPRYPAAYPTVLSVGNTDETDALHADSNFGPTTDVAAPGVGIRATQWGGDYGNWTGTSFSAPVTAAIAGLLRSAFPAAPPTDIRAAITANTDACCTNKPEFPAGRINAAKAYEALGGTLPPPPADTTKPTLTVTAPAADATVSGMVGITADAADDVGVTKVTAKVDDGEELVDEEAPYAISWDTTAATNGAHTITVTAYDAAGNTEVATLQLTVQNEAAEVVQGDLNNDAKVDLTDLSILLTNWGTDKAEADVDKDGKAGLTDLSILLSNWTANSEPGPAPAPAPTPPSQQ